MSHVHNGAYSRTRTAERLRAAFLAIVAIASVSALADEAITAPVRKVEVSGIKNFSRIDGAKGSAGALVGFGGATQSLAMPALRAAGFAAVINLRLAAEPGVDVDAGRAAAEAAGLKYIHLPFDAANPDPDLVDEFFAAVADRRNQPVYIHCSSANRVGALWMILRVLRDGWEIEPARTEARAIGLTAAVAEQFATTYISSHRQ